ncbi:hydroxyacid dehydrogenase [Pontiellaceae bacterium B12219]|nr:hydroxyacid dehydrogenase [Pontiellaceae bacterium B12219]
MTVQERKEFLPEPLNQQLKTLIPEAVHVNAPVSDREWKTLLERHQPEIVLCAWETPAIPAEATSHLKYVCYLCGSVRTLVPRNLIKDGLLVTNWGSTVSNTVAECTLLLILATLRRMSNWTLAMHTRGEWKVGRHPDTLSLFNRRVGLHGLGAIGRDLVKLLAPFNVTLSAYSPSVPDKMYRQLGVHRADTLEELFSTSDVLVELAPGKPENYHLVGETLFNLLPEQAVFVNVGRGMVVDEEAMIRVSQKKGIHLGIDVYETEPLPKNSPLRGLPNTTLLPHLGGPTPDRRRDCGELAIQNIRNYINGDPLINLINLEAYDRAT